MPPHLKRILPDFFFMTSHLDSHKTTDIKPEMLSGVQTGNGSPHSNYNIRGIPHARAKKKDDIFMQRRLVQNFTFILEWGQETCSLTKHTWHIPLCSIFPLHAAFQTSTLLQLSYLLLSTRPSHKFVFYTAY